MSLEPHILLCKLGSKSQFQHLLTIFASGRRFGVTLNVALEEEEEDARQQRQLPTQMQQLTRLANSLPEQVGNRSHAWIPLHDSTACKKL